MAFGRVNNAVVEKYSSKVVYENLYGEIQHINGKGCVDTYTKPSDARSVFSIDVARYLPGIPYIRQVGSANNGGWANELNDGAKNAPQSTFVSIPVDLVYDVGTPMNITQLLSNELELKKYINEMHVKTMGLAINCVTYAKQFAKFFALKTVDSKNNFSAVSTDEELATTIFPGDRTLGANEDGSYADAFLSANATFNDGIPELGAFVVPTENRQAFVTPQFDRIMKRQYMQNASEASARILANGFINPFTNTAETKINASTGLCGMYDGVDLVMFNAVTRSFVEVMLGLSSKPTEKAIFEKIECMIVYAGGTLRGIVGPYVGINVEPHAYDSSFMATFMKIGVECISAKSVKIITNGAILSTDIDKLTKAIKFTPIDGKTVTGLNAFGANTSEYFNDGTSK